MEYVKAWAKVSPTPEKLRSSKVDKPSGWLISSESWDQIIHKIPIPCVDTIIHKDNKVLLGYRTILPYRNVWALIGGRMHYGESFNETAIRNCRQSGLTIRQLQYLGVFPVKFPKGRHDLSFCVAARHVSGEPKPTPELSRYTWVTKRDLTRIHPIGANYLKMLEAWWCPQQSSTWT